MRSVNKVILIGNLTRDPELRQTQSGQPVTTFSIATNRVWVTKDGKRQTSTEYHDLVAWSRLAEICHKYLKKSKLVYVEGYLKTRSWDTPEGIRKFKTEVVVQDMIMLDKRQDGDEEMDELVSFGSDDISTETEAPAEEAAAVEMTTEEAAPAKAPAEPETPAASEESTPTEAPAAEPAPVETPETPAAPAETPASSPAPEAAPVAPAEEEKPSTDESVF